MDEFKAPLGAVRERTSDVLKSHQSHGQVSQAGAGAASARGGGGLRVVLEG